MNQSYKKPKTGIFSMQSDASLTKKNSWEAEHANNPKRMFFAGVFVGISIGIGIGMMISG